MTVETNAERLEIIKDKQLQSHALSSFDIEWLINRVEELENSTTVHIIKRRNGKATIIGWNGERYVYQSESSARGGIAKRG